MRTSRPWIAVALAGLIVILPLWAQFGVAVYFDWPLHLYWMDQFGQSLAQGLVYPRWIAGANGGLGSPAFVFYPPLAYFLGGAIAQASGSALIGLKSVYGIATVIGALAGYGLLRSLHRGAAGSATASLIALPPMLMLVYRYNMPGAALAAALSPWVLLGVWSLRHATSRSLAGIAPPFALVLLSHPPTALMLGLASGLLAISGGGQKDGLRRAVLVASALVLGLMLAAFYWLPALWEMRYVHAEALVGGPLDWRANLLFDPAVPALQRLRGDGPYLEASAAIVLLTMLAAWVFAERSARERHSERDALRRWGVLALCLFALATPLGSAFYRFVPGAALLQFGWRWLPLFAVAAVATIVLALRLIRVPDWMSIVAPVPAPLIAITLSFPLLWNTGTLLPSVARTTPTQVAWSLVASRIDPPEHRPLAIPVAAAQASAVPTTPTLVATYGTAHIAPVENGAERRVWQVDTHAGDVLRFKTLCFPGWRVEVDGADEPFRCDANGLMTVRMREGKHRVEQRFDFTADRWVGMWISAAGFLALAGLQWRDWRRPDRRPWLASH